MHFVIQDSFIFTHYTIFHYWYMTNELKIKPMSCVLFFFWLKVKNVEKNKTANTRNCLHITVGKLKCIHTTQQCMQCFFLLFTKYIIFIRVSKTIVNILWNEIFRCFIWYRSWFIYLDFFLTSVCLQHIQYKDPPHPMTNCS